MNLSLIERKVLRIVGDVQGDRGVDYSHIGDMVADGAALRVLTSLEMKGLVHLDGETAKLTSLGAVVLQTYR